VPLTRRLMQPIQTPFCLALPALNPRTKASLSVSFGHARRRHLIEQLAIIHASNPEDFLELSVSCLSITKNFRHVPSPNL
jgi:hypothetical protein